MKVVGLKAECFPSAQAFLKKKLPDVASCLVLEVRMPGASGLSFQEDLTKAGIDIPIIERACHEGRRCRVPGQAVPRSGHARRRPAYARGPLIRLRRLLATLVQAANDLRLAATTNIAVA